MNHLSLKKKLGMGSLALLVTLSTDKGREAVALQRLA
jgi:hypothetical protein